MGDFQLILLGKRDRPVREALTPGVGSVIQFRSRVELEMAAENAAEREITVEELASWWSPNDALAYATTCIGDRKAAANAIWQRLVAGLIKTVASTSSMTVRDRPPTPKSTPELIPPRFWAKFSKHGSDFWSVGDAKFFLSGSGMATTYQCFGIKLNPADIRDTFPPPRPLPKRAEAEPEPKTAAPLPLVNKGGRPRKDWWDDFWIEICRQIWEGELNPKTQAELETAMLEWVENHRNADVGETTIKMAARKLFKAWKLGSKNLVFDLFLPHSV